MNSVVYKLLRLIHVLHACKLPACFTIDLGHCGQLVIQAKTMDQGHRGQLVIHHRPWTLWAVSDSGIQPITTGDGYFYDWENMTGDDRRLSAVTFCEGKIVGGSQIRQCDW